MLSATRYLLGVAEIALLVAAPPASAPPGCAPACCRASPGRRPGSPPRSSRSRSCSERPSCSGAAGLFEPVPYLLAVVAVGLGLRLGLAAGDARRPEPGRARSRPGDAAAAAWRSPAVVIAHFCIGVRLRLSTGMTGFDTTWYHAPFAAGLRPERADLRHPVHRAAVPRLVLPPELGAAARDRDPRLLQGPALAAPQPRLARRLPARRLVHRAPLGRRAGLARRRRPGPRQRRLRRPGRERPATTSSRSSSSSPRSRSSLNAAGAIGPAAGAPRRQLRSRRRHRSWPASRSGSPPGPRSTTWRRRSRWSARWR